MRRLAPLLLLALPMLGWAATSDSDVVAKSGACVYARPATTATAMADADAPAQARPATPPAARTAPKPATTPGGGGGDSDAMDSRARGIRWHSFLPGMFR